MSLDVLRRDALTTRRHELTKSSRSQLASARALRSVTNLFAKNSSLSPLINTDFDTENSPPTDPEEVSWLKSIDLTNGRYFDDTSIPFPSILQDDEPISIPNTSIPSTQTSDQPQAAAASPHAPDTVAEAAATTSADQASAAEPMTRSSSQRNASALPTTHTDGAIPETYVEKASQELDGPVALPDQIAPPQPEEEAELSDETQQLLDLERPERPAKVVHLPPLEAQDEKQDEAEDRRRKSVDTDSSKTARNLLQAHGEAASSPSSTVDAYSAATPMPPQDSPDTSPDSEHGEEIAVLPPKDLRPSPEEQLEKEEHDRLLEAQKELARKQALGDVSTPDDQLRWEEREAAARDAEEQAARQDANGSEPDDVNEGEETQADEVMQGAVAEKQEEPSEDAAMPSQDGETSTAVIDDSTQPPVDEDEDGDNITVTPRNKAPLTIDTSRLQQPPPAPSDEPAPTSPEQVRMTTRTSSGALQKRSVSEILGQTPAQSVSGGRSLLSPALTMSPTTMRHPQDTATERSSNVLQTPRRHERPPGPPRTPSNAQAALEDLVALKGAAEDPDRDYLEPLFRIQAHDSPNVRTTALPDLIKSASKTISTEDQYTSLHERVDYRILRRIYHLQNANKWSLRQMERCKEPPQPETHHDHMMAEMMWMRKDFKAERRMKKSVCAWLAQRCAEYVAASEDERIKLRVTVRLPQQRPTSTEQHDDEPPELEQSGDSAPEDDVAPPTPRSHAALPKTLIVPHELSDTVSGLQETRKLRKALGSLPVVGMSFFKAKVTEDVSFTLASKFSKGKILPQVHLSSRKRSRFEYEDDSVPLDQESNKKRLHEDRQLEPQDQEIALFHPDNKHIRDRLHANNAFRPPSEFVMPSTSFYEYRNGSQWIWEDDQKLRKLAKEYSFNWSLIADELQIPTLFKSQAERRTPWECFERWVELEQMPTEMKKTMYFKTWYQRLEQSQQAGERRYQAQLAAMQAQNNSQTNHIPLRKRMVPARVEKRKATRYLWLVDAMRKLARKKEQQAYKQAEAQRAAAQRKSQNDNNPPRNPMLTPQEFSQKRHERDMQMLEAARIQRQKLIETQQRQFLAARQAQAQAQQQQQGQGQGQGQQQSGQNGTPNQQRPGSSSNMPAQQAQMQANGQQQPTVNGQMPQQQARPSVPMATKNGHLAVPQMSAQGVPQAQMRAAPNGPGQMPNQQDMQRMAQVNAQARNGQYYGDQLRQLPTANMQSPGSGGMNAQQQMQSNSAMLASMQQQMNNMNNQQGAQQMSNNHQMSASPSMPPPPTPQNHPQQLSSGHVPALLNIKNNIRQKYPNSSEEQVNAMATELLKRESQQTTSQARQNAMNAAAGINGGVAPQAAHGGNMQSYNQAAFQQNQQMPTGGAFINGSDERGLASSPQQQQYAQLMRQRQLQQMRLQQSPNAAHAQLANGSPGMSQATPVSPSMSFSNMNQMGAGMNMNSGMPANQQRPPSRSATPQMQRLGSSGSMAATSPQGLQGSPRNMQASMAR